MAWAEVYFRTKWHLRPSSRLATIDMGRKLGAPPAPFWGGELSPHLAQCGLGRDLDPLSRLATMDIGRKLGDSPSPFGGRELGPHLTQCGQGRGLPACHVSSWSIQPFGHSAPTSQTGQTGQDRQRSNSIGRTVLQRYTMKLQHVTSHVFVETTHVVAAPHGFACVVTPPT